MRPSESHAPPASRPRRFGEIKPELAISRVMMLERPLHVGDAVARLFPRADVERRREQRRRDAHHDERRSIAIINSTREKPAALFTLKFG